MKNKDDLILEQLYQEGIIDRLGSQFKGVKAGGAQVLQNLGRKLYQKAGGEGMPEPSQTAGQAYAKAQQKSLLNSFIKKANNEIEDFRKDLLAMGVSGDPEEIKKTHPAIAQRLKQVESLLNYLNNPSTTPAEEAPAPAEATVPSIWLNTQQARDFLGVTNKELWNLSKNRKIKAIKRPNGNYKFSRQSLEKYKNKDSVSTESYNVFGDFLKKYNLI